jgi:hypothetical protein
MVSAKRQTQSQPENAVWTVGQRWYDFSDLEGISIQNSHPNGGHIKALFNQEGNLVQVLAAEEFLSGRLSPWYRARQAPSEEVQGYGTGTTGYSSVSLICPLTCGLNWVNEIINTGVLGATVVGTGTSGVALSNQVSPRPHRRRDSNLPPASAVADHLIGAMPCSEEVAEFARGLYGKTPTEETIRTANTIFKEATGRTEEYDFYVDESEGAMGFMLRLKNGLLLLAELSTDGRLSGGTYVDSEDEAREVEFLPNATVEEMTNLF